MNDVYLGVDLIDLDIIYLSVVQLFYQILSFCQGVRGWMHTMFITMNICTCTCELMYLNVSQ